MIIKLFKKCENQAESNMSVQNATKVIHAGSVKSLLQEIGSANRSLYRAVKAKAVDFGEGDYFVAEFENSICVVHTDWNSARVIHKVGKGYIQQNLEMTRRGDKTWIYEIDTVNSNHHVEKKEVVKFDINNLEELSVEEMMEIIRAQHAALKKANVAIQEAEEEVEVVKEELVEVKRKSEKHFAQKTTATKSRNLWKKKFDTVIYIAKAGGDTAAMVQAAESLESDSFFDYEESLNELDLMEKNYA